MSEYDIAIVGAGITGAALAALLAADFRVLVLDRDVAGLPGSTGHAPGFVGQLNQVPALTELARRSVRMYEGIDGGFERVGGIEVAIDEAASLQALHDRLALAHSYGLEAQLLTPEATSSLAPDFVDARAKAALHFPEDGTANARVIAHTLQSRAKAAGAALVDTKVTSLEPTLTGFALQTTTGTYEAKQVVLATGVWGTSVAHGLAPGVAAAPVAVAHPYAYTKARAERGYRTPFVRWPTQHVYARDHGTRDGMGSYAHDPIYVASAAVKGTAYGKWDSGFARVLDDALGLLPRVTRRGFENAIIAGSDEEGGEPSAHAIVDKAKDGGTAYAFNGLFTVTPDGQPLVGRLSGSRGGPGLWCALGCWVTHAGGCAGVLASQLREALGKKGSAEEGFGVVSELDLRRAMDPLRFEKRDAGEVRRKALGTYNDIYNREA